MSALPYDDIDADWDGRDAEPLPAGRQRGRWFTPLSAVVLSLLLAVIGFYVGIRVERSHVTSSGSAVSASSGTRAGASTSGPPAGLSGTASRSSRSSGSAKTSSASSSGAPSFGAGGPGGSAGGGTSGTVASVDRDTIYVKESSGDTVKVKLLGTTSLTKSVSVTDRSIHPGDTISIAGSAGSGGAIEATSVSDSGNSSTSTSSTSTG